MMRMQNSSSRSVLYTWRANVRQRKADAKRRERIAKITARMARGTAHYSFFKWTRWARGVREERQRNQVQQGPNAQALIAKIRSDNLMARISGRFFHQYRTQSFFKWKQLWQAGKQHRRHLERQCRTMVKRMQVSLVL